MAELGTAGYVHTAGSGIPQLATTKWYQGYKPSQPTSLSVKENNCRTVAARGYYKSNKYANDCKAGSVHRGLRSWVISFCNRKGLEVTYEDCATTVPRAAAGEVDSTQLWVAMMWHCKLDLTFLFK